jgi:hypothetical protein
MLKIENTKVEHLESIKEIAINASPFLVANNHMIYYLCCTVFSQYSFVIKRDEKIIGYLFSMKDSADKYIWIHQLAIIRNERKSFATAFLIKALINKLKNESTIRILRFAIRNDNEDSIKMISNKTRKNFSGINYKTKYLGVDENINPNYKMGVFEVSF